MFGLGNRRKRKKRPFVNVRCTLRSGERLQAGDRFIERVGERLIISAGDETVFVVTDAGDSTSVQCLAYGRTPVKSVAQPPPPVRMGPGGDFVFDWPQNDEQAFRAEYLNEPVSRPSGGNANAAIGQAT